MKNDNQKIKTPIYLFTGFYDTREDCYGPCPGDEDDYLEAIYYDVYRPNDYPRKIDKKDMKDFEKGKIIIKNKKHVRYYEALKICEEEINNPLNKTKKELKNAINKRINDLSLNNDPKYKEKKLLERINELYYKVKGEFIKEETLYNGKFLKLIKETYKLPNNKTVNKEKIVKNKGKDAVIIIPTVESKNIQDDVILTFQSRINNAVIAEFPSGYIEKGETPIEAAKRELLEETGYDSKWIVLIDEAYTSPGIDNSKTYIVLAEDCYKVDNPTNKGTELLNYGVFTRKELDYFISFDIMGGAMNRLAYYNYAYNKRVHWGKEKNLNYKFKFLFFNTIVLEVAILIFLFTSSVLSS